MRPLQHAALLLSALTQVQKLKNYQCMIHIHKSATTVLYIMYACIIIQFTVLQYRHTLCICITELQL